MGISEEQIRKMVALKDDLQTRLSKHLEEVEMLENSIEVLDGILKETSFTKASSLVTNSDAQKKEHVKSDAAPTTDQDMTHQVKVPDMEKPVPITGGRSGKMMAKAYVTPEQISIVPENDVSVSMETKPFKSFFLDRIIGDMKRKDDSDAGEGKIQKESVISHEIIEQGQYIKEIIIRNYRHQDRVKEITNTVGWSLARMVENVKK